MCYLLACFPIPLDSRSLNSFDIISIIPDVS